RPAGGQAGPPDPQAQGKEPGLPGAPRPPGRRLTRPRRPAGTRPAGTREPVWATITRPLPEGPGPHEECQHHRTRTVRAAAGQVVAALAGRPEGRVPRDRLRRQIGRASCRERGEVPEATT